METFAVAATRAVAPSPSSIDLGQTAAAPSNEPDVRRWPGWARLLILIGGSTALWGAIGWAAARLLKLA